jgi:hypothetical protein
VNDDARESLLRLLVDNFQAWCANCANILTKTGKTVPFTWNRAQRHIHEKLEAQKAEKGFVRALILKGRQQGCCLDPDTKVLTADLHWSRIADLVVGQELVATDEETSSGVGGRGRQMRTAVVEAVVHTRQPTFRITLDDGRSVITSGKHRWLVRKSQTQWLWRAIDGDHPDGRDGIKVGDKMRSITQPWGEPSLGDAWFGGVIDGEGSMDCSPSRTGIRLAVSQRAGAVLDRMESHCRSRDWGHYIVSDDGPRKTKLGQDPVHAVNLSSLGTMFEVMGLCRPVRFIDRHWWEGKSMPDNGERVIVSIEPLGERDVVDIQTSTGTFVAEGLVSHNSTYVGARFYHHTSTQPGRRAFIVAHEEKATSNLFSMVKRYHDYNPMKPSTKASNAQELIFGALDSGYKLATAGSKDVGRSNTAQVLHGCLAAGTLVQMADGTYRGIDKIQPGDMLITRQGVAASVKGTSWHPDTTVNVKLAMNRVPIRATKSHKFFTSRGMVPLSELAPGDELGLPIRQITGAILDVPFASERSERAQGGGRTEVAVPDRVALTFELGRVLGLYLAEGYVALQSKEPHSPGSVVFACHERELERNTSWLRCVTGWSSLNERENKGSKTRMTVAYGRQFSCFVERMCGRKGGKHLPAQWWQMPREFVRGLLVGYLAGDGHCSATRDRRIQAPSIVPAISYGMRDVVAALGFGMPSVGYREAGVRNERNEKAQFTLRITGDAVDQIAPMLGWTMPERQRPGRSTIRIERGYAWLPIESIDGATEEMVWDIEVDHEDHDYCLSQCATSNSEFAFWDNAQAHLAGLGNTISDGALAADTEIILESTANGLGNAFHLMWQDAERGIGEYIAIFVPWFWQDEYRSPVRPDFELDLADQLYQATHELDLEQMQWRANKILSYGKGYEWLFPQEYPATPAEAFRAPTGQPLIDPTIVQAAANSEYLDLNAPLVIGCDPASDGLNHGLNLDRTAIVFRRGRVVIRCETHQNMKTTEVAALLSDYNRDYQPDAMFIDKGGIGAGIYDRLVELSVPVIGVMFGAGAHDSTKYLNKRAEMWWLMKEWLEDQPCRIPNDAGLIADLSAPQPKERSDRKKQLESKAEMTRRQIRSPDLGDALCLTFAETVQFRTIPGSVSGATKTATSAGY